MWVLIVKLLTSTVPTGLLPSINSAKFHKIEPFYVNTHLRNAFFKTGGIGVIKPGNTLMTFCILFWRTFGFHPKSEGATGTANTRSTIPIIQFGAVINGCHLKVEKEDRLPSLRSTLDSTVLYRQIHRSGENSTFPRTCSSCSFNLILNLFCDKGGTNAKRRMQTLEDVDNLLMAEIWVRAILRFHLQPFLK